MGSRRQTGLVPTDADKAARLISDKLVVEMSMQQRAYARDENNDGKRLCLVAGDPSWLVW